MADVLNADKKTAVIGALAEGSSIRSIERITGVHGDTIMRAGHTRRAGLHDAHEFQNAGFVLSTNRNYPGV